VSEHPVEETPNIVIAILGRGNAEQIVESIDDLKEVLELQGLSVHRITIQQQTDDPPEGARDATEIINGVFGVEDAEPMMIDADDNLIDPAFDNYGSNG